MQRCLPAALALPVDRRSDREFLFLCGEDRRHSAASLILFILSPSLISLFQISLLSSLFEKVSLKLTLSSKSWQRPPVGGWEVTVLMEMVVDEEVEDEVNN